MTLLMVFQLVLFSWIYIPELSGRWADISPLLSTVLVASLVLVVLVMVYYRWFDRIPILHKIIGYASRVFIIFYLLQWFFLVLYWIILPPLTFTQLGSMMGGFGLRRDYVAYDQISAHMKLAVLASEDQLFTDHDGFDVKSIKLALKYNKRKPGKTRGASTISQQTAKNIFSIIGKCVLDKDVDDNNKPDEATLENTNFIINLLFLASASSIIW